MSATFTKNKFSASTDGRGIKVVATSSAGTTIHTATSSTTTGWDEVWLYAYNSDTASRLLTVQFGGTTSPDDDIKLSIPAQAGEILVVPGFVLQNSDVVKAYAAAANVVVVNGWVNRIA